MGQSRWAVAGVAVTLTVVWAALSIVSQSRIVAGGFMAVGVTLLVTWGTRVGWGSSPAKPRSVQERMMLWLPALPGLLLCTLVFGCLVEGLRDRGCRRGGLDELQWLVRARAHAQCGARLGAFGLVLWRRT